MTRNVRARFFLSVSPLRATRVNERGGSRNIVRVKSSQVAESIKSFAYAK